jgi:hypothetical protein
MIEIDTSRSNSATTTGRRNAMPDGHVQTRLLVMFFGSSSTPPVDPAEFYGHICGRADGKLSW